jgi:hypothetical protein
MRKSLAPRLSCQLSVLLIITRYQQLFLWVCRYVDLDLREFCFYMIGTVRYF